MKADQEGPRSLQKDSGFTLSEVGAVRGPGEVAHVLPVTGSAC